MFFSKSFIQYTHELADDKYLPLSKKDERELLYQYKQLGREDAFNKLILAHLRFVVYLLGSYKIPQFMNVMDVIQEGNIGFIVSLPKFDVNKCDCRIATYAQYWVRFYINKVLTSRSTAAKTLSYVDNICTLENAAHDSGLQSTWGIEGINNTDAKKVAYQNISDYVSINISRKEFKIISLLLGLEPPYKRSTLKDVGSMVHLHAERVRQIKEAALDKLKNQNIHDKLLYNS